MWPLLLKWPLFCVLRASFVILFGLPSEEAAEHFGLWGVVHIREWLLNQP